MLIEKGNAHTSYDYWTVLVREKELQVESGKRLRYSTWIGVLRPNRIPTLSSVWSPTGCKPRGYRKAALELLCKAYHAINDAGWPASLELQPREVMASEPKPVTYLDTARVTRARWTPRPLCRSVTGYGPKLPTSLLLQLDSKRWHRVYVMQWSNAGTAYVLIKGERHVLESSYDPSLDGVPTTYDSALALG